MNVFVEEKTLNDSDFDEIDEFSSIKKELQVFCGTADSTLQLCVLSKEYGLILALSVRNSGSQVALNWKRHGVYFRWFQKSNWALVVEYQPIRGSLN